MKNLLFIIGTRPEAIKLAPLIIYLQKNYQQVVVNVCITAQHRGMLDEVLSFFSIVPDFDLDLMRPDQDLSSLTAAILFNMDKIYENLQPDLVIVQGDTTTAMAGSLSAFYKQIPIVHIEAGLRSFEMYEPFPEEINRRIVGQLATYHFCPTNNALGNLMKENILGKKYVVGNTVIDALLLSKEIINRNERQYTSKFPFIEGNKRYILVTVHRRENFGIPLQEICMALIEIINSYPDVELIIPVHPNPNIKLAIEKIFKGIHQVHLLPPLPYDDLIWIMNNCYFVLTDSGGIQEEAPTLGKPVLVLRNVTERMEGINAGTAVLVGNKYDQIMYHMKLLLDSKEAYTAMENISNPYGDGDSSKRICEILIP